MQDKEELLSNLAQFTGTGSYHRYSMLFRNVVLTDGVKYLAKSAECFWLMDIIASVQKKLRNEPFQSWKVTVKDRMAVVSCTDGNDKKLYTQRVDYTDFPLDELKLFCQSDGEMVVIMLTNEY